MAKIIFKDSDLDKKVKSNYPKSIQKYIKWKKYCLISLGFNLILIGTIIYLYGRS